MKGDLGVEFKIFTELEVGFNDSVNFVELQLFSPHYGFVFLVIKLMQLVL